MDDPDLAPEVHDSALRGLARLNAVSLAARPIVREILAREWDGGRLSLMDVAIGAGDVPTRVVRALRPRGLTPEVVGVDVSPLALERASERLQAEGVRAECLNINVADDRATLPEADVVTCSLFLHHLRDEQVGTVLERLGRAARRLLVVSDLRRAGLGPALAWASSRLLTRSPVVHVDAVRSYRGALSLAELREHARRAGLVGARVDAAFPLRMVLVWDAGRAP